MSRVLLFFLLLFSVLCGAENVDVWDIKPLGPEVKLQEIPKSRTQRKAVLNRKYQTIKGPELFLVKDHKALGVIVTDGTPGNRRAARLLSEKIKASAGEALPVFNESEVKIVQMKDHFTVSAGGKEFPCAVFIGGENVLKNGMDPEKLPEQGFEIRCFGNAMLISGNALYAVVDFLEQYGFRSLWPGKSGQVVPKLAEFKVTPFELSDHPAILERGMRCEPKYTPLPWNLSAAEKKYFTPEEFGKVRSIKGKRLKGLHFLQLPPKYLAPVGPERAEWALWQRIGSSRHKIAASHSYMGWWKKYGKEHPEYFALQKNGTRHPKPKAHPDYEQLCFSNPDTIKAIAAERVADVKKRDLHSVSISPNDPMLGNDPCMCLRCRRLDPPNGSPVVLKTGDRYVALSDRMFSCFNKMTEEILKEQPQLQVGVIAYAQYRTAPLAVKVHPKLAVGYVGISYADSAVLAAQREEWMRWAGAAEKLFWRPNLFWSTHSVMTNFARDVAQDIRNMYCTGMIGTDIDTFGSDWSSMGLTYYVVARMLWNPALSVDEMIDDYCKTGFGPAAKEIRQYFDLQETLTRRNAACAAKSGKLQAVSDADNADPAKGRLSWAKFWRCYTDEDFTQLQSLLDRAKAAAKDDQEVLVRIDFLQLGLDFTRNRIKLYKLCFGKPQGTKEEICAAAQKQYDILIKAGVENPHALSVAYIAFWDEQIWSQFGWKLDPAKTPRAAELLKAKSLKKKKSSLKKE